jgi:hypothetical protein
MSAFLIITTDCPLPVFLSRLSCPARPVLADLSRQTWPGWSVRADQSWHTLPLVDLSMLTHPGCPVTAVLSRLSCLTASCPGCLVSTVLSRISCPGCLALAVLLLLSYSGCFRLSCWSCLAMLCWKMNQMRKTELKNHAFIRFYRLRRPTSLLGPCLKT